MSDQTIGPGDKCQPQKGVEILGGLQRQSVSCPQRLRPVVGSCEAPSPSCRLERELSQRSSQEHEEGLLDHPNGKNEPGGTQEWHPGKFGEADGQHAD